MSISGNSGFNQVFLILQRPYQDNSALLEVFSRDFGRVGLVAKRLRGKRNNRTSLLQPFYPLMMTWRGRSDLKTMMEVEADGAALQLSGRILLSGFYVNELLLRLLHREDPHPELFDQYVLTIRSLACLNSHQAQGADLQICLRVFEKQLLEQVGYGLLLECDFQTGEEIDPDLEYYYRLGHGPTLNRGNDCRGCFRGATLLALAREQFTDPDTLRQSKQLTRLALDHYLGGKELNSRKLLLEMQQTFDGHAK